MAQEYWLVFGSGDTRNHSGLAPTFVIFASYSGVALTPPGITEAITSSGLYKFEYSPSFSIAFLVDGATTGLATADRYIPGSLDPLDMVANSLSSTMVAIGNTAIALGTTGVALGTSNVALGTSNIAIGTSIGSRIGSTASSFGDTTTDPGDLYGYLKRLQEINEGNANFNKVTGTWDIYSRGSSTLLREKTLTNTSTTATKT